MDKQEVLVCVVCFDPLSQACKLPARIRKVENSGGTVGGQWWNIHMHEPKLQFSAPKIDEGKSTTSARAARDCGCGR